MGGHGPCVPARVSATAVPIVTRGRSNRRRGSRLSKATGPERPPGATRMPAYADFCGCVSFCLVHATHATPYIAGIPVDAFPGWPAVFARANRKCHVLAPPGGQPRRDLVLSSAQYQFQTASALTSPVADDSFSPARGPMMKRGHRLGFPLTPSSFLTALSTTTVIVTGGSSYAVVPLLRWGVLHRIPMSATGCQHTT